MAVGWMSALKLVPWGEVIEAAPHILQGARRLIGNARKAPPPAAAPAAVQAPHGDGAAGQIAVLQSRLALLEEDQRASAALIQSLAEQNAQLVRAVDALRQRGVRLLLAICGLGACTLALLAWAMSR